MSDAKSFANRMEPSLSDFASRHRALLPAEPPASPESFFTEDDETIEAEALEGAVPSGVLTSRSEIKQESEPAMTVPQQAQTTLNAPEVVRADLAGLGYDPDEITTIIAGTWSPSFQAKPAGLQTGATRESSVARSSGEYLGFPLASAVGTVLHRMTTRNKG